MKTKWGLFLAGMIFLILVISGCAPVTATPFCSTALLQAPVLTGPTAGEVVSSLSPSLTWSYPDPICNPQVYTINLRSGPLFTDNIGGSVGNSTTSWSPTSPLQPGKEYVWDVRASDGANSGPSSETRYFFTGSQCDAQALKAPVLLQPADGSFVTQLSPSLIWDYQDSCLAQGYRVYLSSESADLSGSTGGPSARWVPSVALKDCTVYSWHVAPLNASMPGPASKIFTFTTRANGTCPTATQVPPTPTPTLSPLITFIPNINANCRSGPGPIYNAVQIAMKGQSYQINGRNGDNTWYQLQFSKTAVCWVMANSGTPSRDTAGMQELLPPPTPTPTIAPPPTAIVPINCSLYTDQSSCEANSCTWMSLLNSCVKMGH